jgi:transcriptional regulatory protein RtcR
MKKKTVVFGMLGMSLDNGLSERRHTDWRPTLSLFKHDMRIDRLELWYQPIRHVPQLKDVITGDILALSPRTKINAHAMTFDDPWDFEEVYLKFHDFAKAYPWQAEHEDYYLHITTGTHVMQVCFFALTEAHVIPARLLQTGDDHALRKKEGLDRSRGILQVIDLRSERYHKIASRFAEQQVGNQQLLKAGIPTRNSAYNQLIQELEEVAQRSDDPILLSGETGVGKTELARRIFELKRKNPTRKERWQGRFVEINCATLRGDLAMSTLFGHKKGAFTGALSDRAGLLKEADGGLLFLDEIGELGLDEQAILLRALEDKIFRPLGSEKTVQSDFVLIAGTNRDLRQDVRQGRFREDLLARIDVWEFPLPSLRDRLEDLEPNIHFELDRQAREKGKQIRFTSEALDRYLSFARTGLWNGNFRDLRASLSRLTTFGLRSGWITLPLVELEILRLQKKWLQQPAPLDLKKFCDDPTVLEDMTPLEKQEIQIILHCMGQTRTLKEAADKLFAGKSNPTDSLRKKLLRYSIDPSRARDILTSHHT